MNPRFWINYTQRTVTYWDGKRWQVDIPFKKVTIKQLLDIGYGKPCKQGQEAF